MDGSAPRVSLKGSVWHFIASASRFIGMRDRLRCPYCQAVGTWKPHGSIFDREDARRVPRWLCKYCGAYEGPEGVCAAFPDMEVKQWQLHGAVPRSFPTPKEVVEAQLGKTWPWRG